MEKTFEINIYSKTFKTKEGKTFTKDFCIYNEQHIECVLTKDLPNKLIKEDIVKPFKATLKEQDHFVKIVKIETPKGTKSKPVIFIKDLSNMEHYELKSLTLENYKTKLDNKTDTVDEKCDGVDDVVITDADMPF